MLVLCLMMHGYFYETSNIKIVLFIKSLPKLHELEKHLNKCVYLRVLGVFNLYKQL